MPDLFADRRDYLGVFGLLETEAGVLLVANRRRIGGEEVLVWDLPGGGVEGGETLEEALRREMRVETGLEVRVGELLFVGEGERIRGGRRVGVWRSFFLGVERTGGAIDLSGDPEVVAHRFATRSALPGLLTAPYHAGFVSWLDSGGALGRAFDRWID